MLPKSNRHLSSKTSTVGILIVCLVFTIFGIRLLLASHAASNPPGDLNGDGTINVFDLSIMLSDWNTNNATADLNGDGTVNVFDLSLLLSNYGKSASSGTPAPPPSTGGGNGTITFDGTFSATDPSGGPHYYDVYGGAVTYVPASQVQADTGYAGATTGILHFAPNQAPSGHARADVCTGGPGSCTSSGNGQVYHQGVGACTTVPFYFPQTTIPNVTGWYQVAEMKSSVVSPDVGQWGMYVNDGSGPHWVVAAQNHIIYSGSVPSGQKWHTGSICTDNSSTIYGIWLDGTRLSFNGSGCSGSGSCHITDWPSGYATQPLDINAYTGNPGSAPDMYHGDPLISTIGSNGLPPMPAGGWNSP